MFSFILVVCLAGVFCLTPLALYLFWLTSLNRRDRPTVMSGGWDFAVLLCGLSGFALFGGGLLLSLLQSNVRFWMRGNFEALRDAWGHERVTWCVIVAAYLVLVVGGSWLTLMARRRTLVVYNVDPGQFEVALTEVLEQIGRPVERRGNLWVGGIPLFELEPFTAGRTVTLRWVSDDPHLFQEVERQIREVIPTLPGGLGPSARWLGSGVVGSAAVVVFCIVLLLYGLALVR
ncbi:MAG: hypothetical protein JWO38_4610 [Gemmataceae bacterium]|nr:hypothetical protein [Gemmataceae bacterium]